MVDVYQLAIAMSQLIASSSEPTPMTLMNHDVNGAAEILSAIVEQCGVQDVRLTQVFMGPELAAELGFQGGATIPHGPKPTVGVDDSLGRQLRFHRD